MKQKLLILIVLCMIWFVPTMSQTGHFISADRFQTVSLLICVRINMGIYG